MNPEPKKNKPFGWPFWILLIGIIAILCNFVHILPPDKTKAARSEAISNLKQIGLALHDFHKQHGSFPNNQTAELLKAKHLSEFNLSGTSSNALFRQLFPAEIVDSETMFYAKFSGISRPDGDTSPGHLLEKSEVAFAYISGLTTEDNPSLPIAFCPLIPGTTKFDPKAFDKRAIILFTDNSVRTYTIRKDGHIYDKGIDILSPEHPIWKGKAPDIRYPE